jgi:putative phosphoribosyl transferase
MRRQGLCQRRGAERRLPVADLPLAPTGLGHGGKRGDLDFRASGEAGIVTERSPGYGPWHGIYTLGGKAIERAAGRADRSLTEHSADTVRRGHSYPWEGVPRGGVVPAAEIARELELPLDVIISRKLRASQNPDFAIGAVAEGGEPYLNPSTVERSEAWRAHVSRETAEQRVEIAHRQQLFRGGEPLELAAGATAILVERLVLAVPVVPLETVRRLEHLVDELVAITMPALFWAIGGFYDDFRQVSDDEVRELLKRARIRCGSARVPVAELGRPRDR